MASRKFEIGSIFLPGVNSSGCVITFLLLVFAELSARARRLLCAVCQSCPVNRVDGRTAFLRLYGRSWLEAMLI